MRRAAWVNCWMGLKTIKLASIIFLYNLEILTMRNDHLYKENLRLQA